MITFNFDTYLEPQTTIYKWMFGETTIFYIKIWNHPIEATIYKWLFGETTIFYIKIWNHPIEATIYKWLFGETTIFYIKIWTHPIETTIYKWLFGVPGKSFSWDSECFFFLRNLCVNAGVKHGSWWGLAWVRSRPPRCFHPRDLEFFFLYRKGENGKNQQEEVEHDFSLAKQCVSLFFMSFFSETFIFTDKVWLNCFLSKWAHWISVKFIWTQGRGQNSGLEAPCGSSGSATWPMFDEDGVIFQQRALI